MKRLVLVVVFTAIATAIGLAQASNQEPATGELQQELNEMRSQIVKLQNRIDELEPARTKAALDSATDSVLHSDAPAAHTPQLQADDTTSSTESPRRHFHCLTFTPGGFLESTILVRARNENADISNSFTAIPLNGSSNSTLSEFRGSVRNSQFSLLMQSTNESRKLDGYFEADFLGAAPTANYVQSSSWTPRLRQLWVRFNTPSGWTFTAGQMWSLLTTNSQGIVNLEELRPIDEDGQYVVGFTWTREKAVRLTKRLNNKLWTALAVEDPETTYSAAYVPPNVMGLNTSENAATGVNLLPYLSNYSSGQSTTLAPDLLAKVALEPGWGHFEIKALGRFFRDRMAATATAKGFTNISEGCGVGFGALMPFKKTLELSLEGLLGQGIGRYGASGLPDATLNPTTGELRPLKEARIMGGLVAHPSRRLDLYAYSGDEYTGRYPFVSPTGGPAGYGSPLVSYTSCTNEIAIDACDGANRNIYEVTVGYWYRLYQGKQGRIEQGNQILYMNRNLWSGTGRAPQGGDVVAYSTLRFYFP